MTKAEIEELEADLRLHKQERLRLRGIETRLTDELKEARAMLRDVHIWIEDYNLACEVRDYLRRHDAF